MWQKEYLSDWAEFTKRFGAMFSVSPETSYLFRGQANDKWQLIPTIARAFPKAVAESLVDTAQEALVRRLEERGRDEFRSQAHRFLKELPTQTFGALDWWVSMQHYRAPTRLLDWTASPAVALYFAVAEEWESDGGILYFNQTKLHRGRTETPRWEGELGGGHDVAWTQAVVEKPTIMAFSPKYKTDRMAAQQAWFTVSNLALVNHGAIIEETLTHDQSDYGQIIVPADAKPRIMAELKRANVGAETLFPGIDGLGLSISEAMRLSYQHFHDLELKFRQDNA